VSVVDQFDPVPLIEALSDAGVDFVLIGGLAGIAHGSAYPTYDVDVMYARDEENLERLATVLRDLGATLRGAPPDLPFQLDARALEEGGNFTFETRGGPLDIGGMPPMLLPFPLSERCRAVLHRDIRELSDISHPRVRKTRPEVAVEFK